MEDELDGKRLQREARGLLSKAFTLTETVVAGRAGLPSQNGSHFPENTARTRGLIRWGKSEGLSLEDLKLTLKFLA